jgi:hypothetical protein
MKNNAHTMNTHAHPPFLHALSLRGCALLTLVLMLPVSGLMAQWEPLRYEMEMEIRYEENELAAGCLLTVRNTSGQSLETLPLRLYKLLEVRQVRGQNGQSLPFAQELTPIEGVPPWLVNAIRITLPDAIKPGEQTSVHISYAGTLEGYPEIMGYVIDRIDESFTIIREDAMAYPGVGEPSLESLMGVIHHAYDYRVTLKVPEHLVVANGGNLVEKMTANGKTAYTYENIKPAWRMDFAVASYQVMESDGFRIFYFPSDGEGAETVMHSAKSALEQYTAWFGPLQGMEKFSLIQIPEGYGSQADVTSILQTADAFRPEQSAKTALYHELSHLWHPRENETSACRWNEGHATFMQYLAAETIDGGVGLVQRASSSSAARFARDCEPGSDCAGIPLVEYGAERMTDHSYTKGMVLFHVLYELIGEEAFLELFRENYRRHAGSGQTTEDLVALILEIPHPAMPRFVQEWFYGLESNDYLYAGKSVDEIVEIYTAAD